MLFFFPIQINSPNIHPRRAFITQELNFLYNKKIPSVTYEKISYITEGIV